MTLPKISKKQQEILNHIYTHRFLNRIQIQTLLKHKDYKTINLWLKDLNEKDYIGKIYSNTFEGRTIPAIYYLGLNGIRYFRALDYPKEYLQKLYREKEKSTNYASDSMLLADICLYLRKTHDKGFSLATYSQFVKPDAKCHFLSDLKPNLVFTIKSEKKDNDNTNYYLLEIFEQTLPLYSVNKRIKEYFDFYFSNTWEDETGEAFPTIIFICPTRGLLARARQFSKQLLNEYDGIEMRIGFEFRYDVKARGLPVDC